MSIVLREILVENSKFGVYYIFIMLFLYDISYWCTIVSP